MGDFDLTSTCCENGTPERPVSFRTTVAAAYTCLWMGIVGEKEAACRAMGSKGEPLGEFSRADLWKLLLEQLWSGRS